MTIIGKESRIKESNLALSLLLLVLSVSLALNVALGWKIRGGSRRSPSVSTVAAGTKLNSLKVLDLKGSAFEISFRGIPRTVLYIMSPTCSFCDKNHANIAYLAKYSRGVRFIGILTSRTSLEKYLATHELPFPLYLTQDALVQVGFRSTPQTVLVNENSVVERNWVGAVGGGEKGYQFGG